MSKVWKTIKNIQDFHVSNNNEIGFVPTMGNLHDGHLSLLKASMAENPITVLSIFVNPKQFGESADLDAYPRTLEADIQKASELFTDVAKELIIFFPEDDTIIYPTDFNDYVSIERLKSISEGKTRPGHFDGVATVVKRLFKLIKPTRAYFGKKDFQQYLLVKEMVKQESVDVQIVGMPIIREHDGLAMSSRNSRLDPAQKNESLKLSKTLLEILFTVQSQGLEKAQELVNKKLEDKRFNYLEIRNAETFELASPNQSELVIVGNFQLGETRLLDNVEVTI